MLGDPILQVLSFYLCLKIDPIKTWPSSYSDKSFLTCGSFEALSEMSTSTPGTSISTLMTNWIFFGSWLRQKTTIFFLLIWFLSHFNLEYDRISSVYILGKYLPLPREGSYPLSSLSGWSGRVRPCESPRARSLRCCTRSNLSQHIAHWDVEVSNFFCQCDNMSVIEML